MRSMLLPTAPCPNCRKDTVVYRALSDDDELQTRCLDCDVQLDRFGQTPEVTERSSSELSAMGYTNLDKPPPVAPGGCFSTRGCDGCPKIDSRPW
jgi:hypothetical protein